MIHIATVHHQNPSWVGIQAEYLRRHISEPFEVWASLEGISPEHAVHVDHVVDGMGRHAGQLNLLAMHISDAADDDDLLVFLDGDAFPIADPVPTIRQALAARPLLAVRRDENVGDPQPHPCFCITTVGFWRSLPGDWSNGAPWVNAAGQRVSDVGGNLLWRLEHLGIEWSPLLRTNRVDLHPLWFGVYGDIVYHHGAGFRRRRVSRFDWVDLGIARGSVGGLRHPLRTGRMRRREQGAIRDATRIEAQLREDHEFFRQFL